MSNFFLTDKATSGRQTKRELYKKTVVSKFCIVIDKSWREISSK